MLEVRQQGFRHGLGQEVVPLLVVVAARVDVDRIAKGREEPRQVVIVDAVGPQLFPACNSSG